MKAFLPENLKEAIEFRARFGALPVSGGTDFMLKFKKPKKPVVYIGKLDEIRGIEVKENHLRIGAGTTLTEILKSPLIPEIFKEAVSQMAAPAIRNVATIGGNICNASPAGDTLPYLYAVDARLVLAGPHGERTVSVENFITGPGSTILGENEVLKEILISRELASNDSFKLGFYRKVGTRRANALSKLSFIGLWRPGDLRVAIGAVAPTVVRDRDAEGDFISGKIDKKGFLDLFKKLIRPIDDQRSTAVYRKTVALRLLEYFINRVLEVRGGFS